MTVNSVDSARQTHAYLNEQLQVAKTEGKDTKNIQRQIDRLENMFPQLKTERPGTTVEKSTDQPLSEEQQEARQAAKQAANKAANDEIAAMKENAQKEVLEKGVQTQSGVISSHGNSVFTFDIKAPTEHMEKTTKAQERERLARYYDEESGEWITGKEQLKAKKQELKAGRSQAEKDVKTLNREVNNLQRELDELTGAGANKATIDAKNNELKAKQQELNEANSRLAEARIEYSEAKQAHKASQKTSFLHKTGIGADKRAYNKNVKANNRLASRVVANNEAEANALKNNPAYKDMDIVVANADDKAVIRQLSAVAKRELEKNGSPNAKAIWGELASLVDEDGNIADTKAVQDALIDITGGDMRLNYTEQMILKKETGRSMSDIRHAFKTYGFEAPNPLGKRIVNGLKAAAPVVATMALSYLLTKSKSRSESTAEAHDHQEAHAEDVAIDRQSKTMTLENTVTIDEDVTISGQDVAHIEGTGHYSGTVPVSGTDTTTTINNYTNTTITNTPGQFVTVPDPDTGLPVSEQLNGTSTEVTEFSQDIQTSTQDWTKNAPVDFDYNYAADVPFNWEQVYHINASKTESITGTIEACAKAVAKADAVADAYASATAVATAIAKLSPAGLVASPLLAFAAGFAKTPVEISAAKRGADNVKLAEFVDMYSKNKNKNIGNQIVQMAGQITGDKGIDRALIVAVLEHDVGSQNNTPTTRELRNALLHLDAIKAEVDKFKKLPIDNGDDGDNNCVDNDKCTVDVKPDSKTVTETKETPNNVYNLGKKETLDSVIEAKYGIKDPAMRKKVREYIRTQMGMQANGIDPKTGKPQIPEIDGQKDAYSFPDKLPDDLGGAKYNPEGKPKTMDYEKKGSGFSAENGVVTTTVQRTEDQFNVVQTCKHSDGTTETKIVGTYPTAKEADEKKNELEQLLNAE